MLRWTKVLYLVDDFSPVHIGGIRCDSGVSGWVAAFEGLSVPASILSDTNVAVLRSTPACIVPTLQSYGCWLQSQHQCKLSSTRCTVAVADSERLNVTVVADGVTDMWSVIRTVAA